MTKKSPHQYSPKEAKTRTDATLKRLLAMPPASKPKRPNPKKSP